MIDQVKLEIAVVFQFEVLQSCVNINHDGAGVAIYHEPSGTMQLLSIGKAFPKLAAAQSMISENTDFYREKCKDVYRQSQYKVSKPLTVHRGASPGSAVVRCDGLVIAVYEEGQLRVSGFLPQGCEMICYGEVQVVEACKDVIARADKGAMLDLLYDAVDSPLKQHLLKALEEF